MRVLNGFGVAVVVLGVVQGTVAQIPVGTPAQKMAATIIREWPAGNVKTQNSPGVWGYEEGTLLDGMAAMWYATANGENFKYIKASVDKYVTEDGTITGYKASGQTLDDIEMGRAVLLVYRVTQQQKYAKAAQYLHEQLALQKRTTNDDY